MTKDITILTHEATGLLQQLIAAPSLSREEDKTAAIIAGYFTEKDIPFQQKGNNIYSRNKHFDESKPTILLNSHHDTVKPNPKYTRDPFTPAIEDGKLYGLGSNDAGGCLVSLASTFLYWYDVPGLKYNLIFAASAEEEISGPGGIELLLPLLPEIDCAIVGEPTILQMAIAERGLMVLDCVTHGKAGHAARNEGDNAIYKALTDIRWFKEYQFPKLSPLLGANKMNVTSIETENKAHNVVPSVCKFIVDTRINELYTFEEVLDIINTNVICEVTPRSTRLRSTSISAEHPLVKAGMNMGHTTYGSPTTSDKALMPFPSLKVGPGDSARSHTADEFIFTDEIKSGVEFYIQLLKQIL